MKFDKYSPKSCTCTICGDCECHSNDLKTRLKRNQNLNANNNCNLKPKISFGCQTELIRKNTLLGKNSFGLIKKPSQSALKSIVDVKEKEMYRNTEYFPCSINKLLFNKHICFSFYKFLKNVKLIFLIPIFTIQSILLLFNKTAKWLGALAVCLIAIFLTGTFFFKYLFLAMQTLNSDELIQKISKLKGKL